MILSEIQRITQGLHILERYKPLASVHSVCNATWCIELQEEEFIDIVQEDRDELYRLGWRNPKKSPYLWKCATEKGLSQEVREKSLLQPVR